MSLTLSTFYAVALLLSLATTALAAGSAHVVNNCGTQVYYASVFNDNGAAMKPLPAGGYSEPFSHPNVGVSIKLALSATGPVTQFEYTWTDGRVFYDTSNIDGNPFAQQGTSLAPSMVGAEGFPSCVIVDCAPGQVCTAAYNLPDDVATKVCPEDSDLTFTLCTSAKISGGDGGAAAAAPAPAPVPAQGNNAGGQEPAPAAPAAPAATKDTVKSPAASTPAAPSAPAATRAGRPNNHNHKRRGHGAHRGFGQEFHQT